LEETAWFQNEVDEEIRGVDSTDKVNVSRAQHMFQTCILTSH